VKDIILTCVRWYLAYPLSYRQVEELLLARGVIVTYEAIRKWCLKFGQAYANQLSRRRPRPGDKWHLDEVFLTINGARHYLWRAVDQDGNILDILVQSRRNKKAAKKIFRTLLKGLMYVPRVIITEPASGSGACRASSPPDTRSDSSPPLVLSPNTSDRGVTSSRPPEYRHEMGRRSQMWGEITGTVMAA
jgi:putative transposase